MFERDRRAATSAEKQIGNVAAENRAQDTLGTMDDAQVMELVTNAYWRLFEQFVSFDGIGTNASSVVNAN
jgi:hypothetical protein